MPQCRALLYFWGRGGAIFLRPSSNALSVEFVQGFAPINVKKAKILAVQTFITHLSRDVILEVHFRLLGNYLTATDSDNDKILSDSAKMMVRFLVCTLICWTGLIHKWLCLISLSGNFKQEVLRHMGRRKMQICSPEDFSTGTITASPSSSLWVSFEKVAWPLDYRQSYIHHNRAFSIMILSKPEGVG